MNQVSVCLTWNFIWAPRRPHQQMLQFYCLLLQFLQFSRHELCYQLHLLIGWQVSTKFTLPLLFSQLFQQWSFHVNIYTGRCVGGGQDRYCAVSVDWCLLVTLFHGGGPLPIIDWSPTRNLTGFYTRCKVKWTQSRHCQHQNTGAKKRISSYRNI